VVSADVAPVAYPDNRYRTVLMWWDRETFAQLAVIEQLSAIMDESARINDCTRHGVSVPIRVDL